MTFNSNLAVLGLHVVRDLPLKRGLKGLVIRDDIYFVCKGVVVEVLDSPHHSKKLPFNIRISLFSPLKVIYWQRL